MGTRNFATLSFLVLFFFSSFVELVDTPGSNASVSAVVEVQKNRVLPPVAAQIHRGQRGAGVSAPDELDSPGDIRGTQMNLAASTNMSWTDKIKTFYTRIQKNCLIAAIYFEARSESQLGQLAVATVILNRVKASNSSSSICGVVYKGANHFNACQFSFACDGKLDVVDDARAWKTAIEIAALALAGDSKIVDRPMWVLASATNYHADCVSPGWSKSLYRLTRIGHHIFYSQKSLPRTASVRKNYI